MNKTHRKKYIFNQYKSANGIKICFDLFKIKFDFLTKYRLFFEIMKEYERNFSSEHFTSTINDSHPIICLIYNYLPSAGVCKSDNHGLLVL